MTLIVEDGTARPNADSYVSAADCSTYAAARGLTFDPAADGAEPALRRATAFIDGVYRSRFPGYPVQLGVQALEWPRIGAYIKVPDLGREEAFLYSAQGYEYIGGLYYVPSNVVPRQVITATCEAACREFAEPGVLAPDLERGNAVQRIQAGSVSIQYGANAPATTSFQVIDLALASLLMTANPFGGRTARG